MTKLLYSQSTATIKPYPRLDDQPIAGLDPDYLVLDKVEVAPISYDPATQSLSSTYVVDTDTLEYRQEWTVTDLLPTPDWDSFNASLITDPAYHQVVANVRASALPGLDTPVVVALGQVATNGVASFALSFPPFCQYGQVTVEQREQWAQLAEAHHLPTVFVEVIRG